MITITNPKVAGFQPVFQEFKGFSCLFEVSPSRKQPGADLYPLLAEALREIYETVDLQLTIDAEMTEITALLAGLGGLVAVRRTSTKGAPA